MSEYWLLRLIMAGGVIGLAAALNLMGGNRCRPLSVTRMSERGFRYDGSYHDRDAGRQLWNGMASGPLVSKAAGRSGSLSVAERRRPPCYYWGSLFYCCSDIWSMHWHIRSVFETVDVI